MEDLIIRLSPCYCQECGEDEIDLYLYNNKPIGYKSMILYSSKSKILAKLDHYELSYAKCNKCNTKFMIDWRHTMPTAGYKKIEFK